jgi:hypothetical protein
VKRAGRAVEPRPAPKARNAAHPQERQHSAAEGGTRDRVRPAGALDMRRLRRPRQGSSPAWAETLGLLSQWIKAEIRCPVVGDHNSKRNAAAVSRNWLLLFTAHVVMRQRPPGPDGLFLP